MYHFGPAVERRNYQCALRQLWAPHLRESREPQSQFRYFLFRQRTRWLIEKSLCKVQLHPPSEELQVCDYSFESLLKDEIVLSKQFQNQAHLRVSTDLNNWKTWFAHRDNNPLNPGFAKLKRICQIPFTHLRLSAFFRRQLLG